MPTIPELARDVRHKLAEILNEDGAQVGGSIDYKVDVLLRAALAQAATAERERIADWLLVNLQPRTHAMAVAALVRKGEADEPRA